MMESNALIKNKLLLVSILSILRFGVIFYWIYWFSTFILPVIFITENGLFLLAKLAMVLDTVDLALVIALSLSWRRTWPILLLDCIVMIMYSWFVLVSFGGFASTIGLSIILLSISQLTALLYIQRKN
jgi:hypothetical protein